MVLSRHLLSEIFGRFDCTWVDIFKETFSLIFFTGQIVRFHRMGYTIRFLTGIYPEIGCQFFCRIVFADPEQAGGKVDNITGHLTAETIIPIVHLHGWMTVIVERTADHATAGDSKSVLFGGLPRGDVCLHGFKNIHTRFLLLMLRCIFIVRPNIQKNRL